MATKTLYAAPYAAFCTAGGTRYTADAYGVISGVANTDYLNLVKAGASISPVGSSAVPSAGQAALRITDALQPTGIPITASANAGTHSLSSTAGASLYMVSEAANNSTKTDVSYFEYAVPSSYVDGQPLTATVNANTTGAGTPGTETVVAVAYRLAKDGTQGANLVTTAAQTVGAAAADYAFNIGGATLLPGDRIMLGVQTVIQETAGTNLQIKVNSVRVG